LATDEVVVVDARVVDVVGAALDVVVTVGTALLVTVDDAATEVALEVAVSAALDVTVANGVALPVAAALLVAEDTAVDAVAPQAELSNTATPLPMTAPLARRKDRRVERTSTPTMDGSPHITAHTSGKS